MKKILVTVLALGLVAFFVTSANAQEEYVAGGFEAAGHIMAVVAISIITTRRRRKWPLIRTVS